MLLLIVCNCFCLELPFICTHHCAVVLIVHHSYCALLPTVTKWCICVLLPLFVVTIFPEVRKLLKKAIREEQDDLEELEVLKIRLYKEKEIMRRNMKIALDELEQIIMEKKRRTRIGTVQVYSETSNRPSPDSISNRPNTSSLANRARNDKGRLAVMKGPAYMKLKN